LGLRVGLDTEARGKILVEGVGVKERRVMTLIRFSSVYCPVFQAPLVCTSGKDRIIRNFVYLIRRSWRPE
jgi:hypothetical protein